MQLAVIDQQQLVLVPETLSYVRTFPIRTKWVSIFGVGRSGKSFIANFLANDMCFSVSNRTQPETRGVWISQLQQAGEDHFVIVDSEGTLMGDTSQQHKILALICLLASEGGLIIQNEKDWSDASIETLALLASTSQIVRGLRTENWPHLCYLIRNFELEMTVQGVHVEPDQFLDYFLSDKGDRHDSDRQLIRDTFVRRMLHTLPPPSANERSDPLHIPPGQFQQSLYALVDMIMPVLQPKRIANVPCDGQMLAAFLEQCVININRDGNLSFSSTVEATMDSICLRVVEDAKAIYVQGMEEIVQSLTGEDAPLRAKHDEMWEAALLFYGERTEGLFTASVEKQLRILRHSIAESFVLTTANNVVVRENKARLLAEEQRAHAQQAHRAETQRREEAERQLQVAIELQRQALAELEVAKRERDEAMRKTDEALQLAKDAQNKAHEIQQNSVTNVQTEIRRVNVGEPQQVETSRKTAWSGLGPRDTVWWENKQKVHIQQRMKTTRGSGAVEYSQWATVAEEFVVVGNGADHENERILF